MLALLVAAAGYAQEMVTVTLKDGSVRKYPSGIETTNIRLWSGAGEGGEMASLAGEVDPNPGLQDVAGVTAYDHSGSEWAVALTWYRDYAIPTVARTGICIGRTPGVTAATCDTLFYDYDTDEMKYLSLPWWVVNRNPNALRYVLLGDSLTFFRDNKSNWKSSGLSGEPYNWCNYPLQRGQTYFYRAFLQVPYVGNGNETGMSYNYGPEQSFRIPNLKEDAGYIRGDVDFSEEAWAEFYRHFPEDMSDEKRTALTRYTIPQLLWEWRATLEELPYDLANARDTTFDNGTVHILPAVPEEFWTWISTHEIVADMASLQVHLTDEGGQWVPQTLLEWVTDVDPAWGIPENRYVVATPNPEVKLSNYRSYNDSVIVNLSEALPGIRYKLTVTLAPETRFTPEQDEEGNYIGENREHFLPVRFRMTCFPISTKGRWTPWAWNFYDDTLARLRMSTPLRSDDNSFYFTTSATELSTYEFTDIDFSCSLLLINSDIRPSAHARGTQTGELHIAEVRLTPVGSAE